MTKPLEGKAALDAITDKVVAYRPARVRTKHILTHVRDRIKTGALDLIREFPLLRYELPPLPPRDEK